MVTCCARRRPDRLDEESPPRRRDNEDDEEVIARWARLYHRWRRVARLKRIWAFLGHRLRELKHGD